jgi:UDP-glucose:(heptosyl)LPS alpha-1,3-glucosyltransferase
LKIGLICKKFSSRIGGLEKYTVFLSRKLVAAGHEVHVFANSWQTESGVTIHRVPMIRFASPLKNLSFAFCVDRVLARTRLDVIHSMERIFNPDIFRVSDGINPVQLMQRYPNPAHRRFKKIGPRRLVLSFLERRIFADGGCRYIMTNSNLVKHHIIEHYQVAPDRISVIYNGVDTTRFHTQCKDQFGPAIRKKYGIDAKELLLLFIANDFKLKRLKLVMRTIAALEKKNIRLMVVGNDDAKAYRQWSLQNGLDRKVLFLGPKKNPAKYYGAADIFILPTRYDAFANVCLEAMACGLPVITTATNGAAELITDGEHGFILRSPDVAELARRVTALDNRAQRSRMGHHAAVKAKGFTPAKHFSEVVQLYEKVRSLRNA